MNATQRFHYTQFIVKKVQHKLVFSQEASTLQFDLREFIELEGRNHTVRYMLKKTVRDQDNDILEWVYEPVTSFLIPAAKNTKIVILND